MKRSRSDRARMLVIAALPREGRVQRAIRRCFIAGNGRPIRSLIITRVGSMLDIAQLGSVWEAAGVDFEPIAGRMVCVLRGRAAPLSG